MPQSCDIASEKINEVLEDNWFVLHFQSSLNLLLKTSLNESL